MRVDIFDVGHGACSVITCPDGRKLMIDCGTKEDAPYWWPSVQFYRQRFAGLIITNFDEDHVTDFEDVRRNIVVEAVVANDTINAARLKTMKVDGMGTGMSAVHKFIQETTDLNPLIIAPQITVNLFRNQYGTFTDTNNLSLVAFVEYGSFCIMFPGDLDAAGWKALLMNSNFRSLLQRVSVAVPSHHGREDGCCDDVFNPARCNPFAFVISDKEMVHETQETTSWYAEHARGVQRMASPWDTRYVFTTRADGCISILAETDGRFVLYPKSSVQTLVQPKVRVPLVRRVGAI